MSLSPAGNLLEAQLGLASNAVRLASYNPDWPILYTMEEARLSATLEKFPHSIEHIGSTAVPGLDAKPVLDIMIGIGDSNDLYSAESELVEIGYKAMGEKGITGRLFLTWGNPCFYHVHLTELHGPFWHEHILFRDQLRQQDRIADDYLQIKLHLARMFPNDRDSYTRGKAHFIEDVLANARRNQ